MLTPFMLGLVGNMCLALGIIFSIFIIKGIKKKVLEKVDYLTSVTVGLLIAIVFLGFFPEIIESGIEPKMFSVFLLLGLLLFYILEIAFHWHHCKDLGHDDHCGSHHTKEHTSSYLMFIGTFIHNGFHGIILFTAFSVNITFGIATTIAILLHSIPQNIANYLMNHKNIKYAYIAGIAGIVGALVTYPFVEQIIQYEYEILSIIAGGLLYTSLTDIFPNFKEKGGTKHKILYLIYILIGISLFSVFNSLSHEYSHEFEEMINNYSLNK